jgi:hypothetical protein
MDRLLRLTRLAAIAIATLTGAAALAPTQAEARQERRWVGGQGMDHHYRPVRQVRREQRWQQRHYVPRHHAPVYYAPAYRAPIYRQQAPVYYQRSHYPAYGYQQHCEVKKRWHGLRKVKKVVCY